MRLAREEEAPGEDLAVRIGIFEKLGQNGDWFRVFEVPAPIWQSPSGRNQLERGGEFRARPKAPDSMASLRTMICMLTPERAFFLDQERNMP